MQFTSFALLSALLSVASASPLLQTRGDPNEKVQCTKTVYGGYLRVDSPSSSHGSVPYNYPLAPSNNGTIVTSKKGEHVDFWNCIILLTEPPQYDTTYSLPPSYGVAKFSSGANAGKCLAISKLPADTNQEAGHQEFVPFNVSECPTNTAEYIHNTWFSIGAQQQDGTYQLAYAGNRTDPTPSLQGHSKVGEAVQGYYGSIGPAAGQFQLNPKAA
ncbi:unnamed protein product [Sympodiomycopsis kandeliae]